MGDDRLFDPTTTRPRTEGELSFDEWLDHPDTAYHASFRHDWTQAPTIHFGTKGTASNYLSQKFRYLRDSPQGRHSYHGGAPDEPVGGDKGAEWEGRVYARRLNRAQFAPVSDVSANTADLFHQVKDLNRLPEDVSGTVRVSSRTSVDRLVSDYGDLAPEDELYEREGEALGAFRRGEAVPYVNTAEYDPDSNGEDNISYVAPQSAVHSWEQAVLNDPNASSMKRAFAHRRFWQNEAGSVGFKRYDRGQVQQVQQPSFAEALRPDRDVDDADFGKYEEQQNARMSWLDAGALTQTHHRMNVTDRIKFTVGEDGRGMEER